MYCSSFELICSGKVLLKNNLFALWCKKMIRKRRSLKGSIQEYIYYPEEKKDFETLFAYFLDQIQTVLKNLKRKSGKQYGLRFQILINVKFKKYSDAHKKDIEIDIWFPSNSHMFTTLKEMYVKINEAVSQLVGKYDSFVSQGSGWTLIRVSRP